MAIEIHIVDPKNNGDPVPKVLKAELARRRSPGKLTVTFHLKDEGTGKLSPDLPAKLNGNTWEASSAGQTTPGQKYTVLVSAADGVSAPGSDTKNHCPA